MTTRKKAKVKALVITGFGLNCERETAAAFELCGAAAELIHLNDILHGKRTIRDFHILAFIGGFSFGDHLGAGTVFANKVKHGLRKDLEAFVADGKLVIGICNGFQTITRLGLVPALDGKLFTQQVALDQNDSGVFRDDWIRLRAEPECPCVFTKGIDLIDLPIRHGEGKFVADDGMLAQLELNNLVALRYVNEKGVPTQQFPQNPNGSAHAIAGICDPTGRIFGLMPHPEAFLSPYNHPQWTRIQATRELPELGEGAAIFKNAVEFIQGQ